MAEKYIVVIDRVGAQPGLDPGHDRFFIGQRAIADRWTQNHVHPLMGHLNGQGDEFIARVYAGSVAELKAKLKAMLNACNEPALRLKETLPTLELVAERK